MGTLIVLAALAAIGIGLIVWAAGRHLVDLYERSLEPKPEPGPEDDPMAETEYAWPGRSDQTDAATVARERMARNLASAMIPPPRDSWPPAGVYPTSKLPEHPPEGQIGIIGTVIGDDDIEERIRTFLH